MTDVSLHTIKLHGWLQRIRDGDKAAHDELLRGVGGRLERLARKMLRGFPQVRRWTETDDVLQNALVRLLRSLEKVEPTSVRAFFGFAAEHLRRELIDLARHYYGAHGLGKHHAGPIAAADSQGPGLEPAAPTDTAAEVERWCAFHEQVDLLPAEERETVSLIFYHAWTQAQVADLLQVDERTVRRRWQSALRKLHHVLHPDAA
jgi:RNA polymerase sigma-70 factor (ECF subfamily)